LNKKERQRAKKPIKTWNTLIKDDKFKNLLSSAPLSQEAKTPTLFGAGLDERKMGAQDRDAFRNDSEESGEPDS